MKRTYIKYDGIEYQTNNCEFWSDCVVYFYPYGSGDQLVIPNGEWTYHEEDIVADKRTFQEYRDYVDLEYELVDEAELEFDKNQFDIDLYKLSKEELSEYYKQRQEYVEAYLKAHLPPEN